MPWGGGACAPPPHGLRNGASMARSRQRISLVGLTGGIGSGKSTALAYCHELGAAVISSDDIVHALLSRGDVIEHVREHFGDAVVDGAGGVSRPALAGIVFADDHALHWLEDLLHPYVRTAVDEWAATQRAGRQLPSLLVVEVPLLFETGFEKTFDYTILITAPDEERRRRLSAKLTDVEFDRRVAQQMAEEDKILRSDFVFRNAGTRKELKEFVGQTVASILAGGTAETEGSGSESPP